MPKTTNRLSQYNALQSVSRTTNIPIPLKGDVAQVDSWTITASGPVSTVELTLVNALPSEYSGEYKVSVSGLSQSDVEINFGNATTTQSSNVISGLSGMSSAEHLGWSVYGNGIPEGSVITEVTNATTVKISEDATVTQAGTASLRISPYGFTSIDPSVAGLNQSYTATISGSSVTFTTELEWSFLEDLSESEFNSLQTSATITPLYNHQWIATQGSQAMSLVSDFYEHKSRYSLKIQPSGTEPVVIALNSVNNMFIGDNGKDFSFNAKVYCNQLTNVQCSLSGPAYEIGDTGPSGGIVFLTPFTPGNNTGKYFEVAPISERVGGLWAQTEPIEYYGLPVPGAGGTAIGTGAQNTADIVAQGNNTIYGTLNPNIVQCAAFFCSEFSYGGKSDWFLPSKDELNSIFNNLHKNSIGNFLQPEDGSYYNEQYYWSSTEGNTGDDSAWVQCFGDAFGDGVTGRQFSYFKADSFSVIPVRMFNAENIPHAEPVVTAVYPGRFTAVRSNVEELPISNEDSYSLDVSITFSGHGGQPFYVTSPNLIEDFLYHSNPYVYSAKRSMPDFYWYIDSSQENPSSPLHRLIDCMMTGARDVYEEYLRIYVYEPGQLAVLSEQIETNNVHSTLVNPEYVNQRYAPWLSQFNGHKLKKNIEYTVNGITNTTYGQPQPLFESVGAKESFIKWQLRTGYYGRAAGTMEALKEATKQVLHYTKDSSQSTYFVSVTPHYQSDPFKILIRTLVNETFDCTEDGQESSAILDAIELARPMGYKVYHQAVDVVEFRIGDTLAGFRTDGTYVPGNPIGDTVD